MITPPHNSQKKIKKLEKFDITEIQTHELKKSTAQHDAKGNLPQDLIGNTKRYNKNIEYYEKKYSELYPTE